MTKKRVKETNIPLALVVVFLVVVLVTLLVGTKNASADTVTEFANASGDCVNTTGIGTVAWSSPGNAFSSNDSYATASVDGTVTNYIKCTNYGFSIPSTNIIDGIVVTIERNATATNNNGATDAAVRVLKGGAIGATDRSTSTVWPTTAGGVNENHASGCPSTCSTTDLWGDTWSPTDINGSNFGAAIAGTKGSGAGSAIGIRVDSISITVYHHASANPAPIVTENSESLVTDTTATLNGSANPNGNQTTGWFRYSSTNPGSCNDTFGTRAPGTGGTDLGSGSSVVSYSENISGLSADTTYYFCAITENSGGKGFGSIAQFTTTSAGATPHKVKIRVAGSNCADGQIDGGCSTGAWDSSTTCNPANNTCFYGADPAGICAIGTWYDLAQDEPMNICTNQNNYRYYKYVIRIEGDTSTPRVEEVILNYAP